MGYSPGQRLGNYCIVRRLDRGGFAEVYLGKHLNLDKQAAIKVLRSFPLSQKEIETFKTEAQMLVNLGGHPHIIRMYEFGFDEDGAPYLVMEYASNGSLRNRYSKDSRLGLEEIVAYVRPVAAALQYAHDRGVIHRDVKPENILLGLNNEVWLSDFGIAVVARSSLSFNTPNVGGTIYYIAPEQLLGKPKLASDQYALGIMVYEWLCGQYPFQGSALEVAYQHQNVLPPSFDKSLQIPPVVEDVVQKALKKDPDERFRSIQVFASSLEDAVQRVQAAQASTVADRTSLHIHAAQATTVADTTSSLWVLHQGVDAAVILYQKGFIANCNRNYELTEFYWLQILKQYPDFRYKENFRKELIAVQEIIALQKEREKKQHIAELRKRAQQEMRRKEWKRAIQTLDELLMLAPQDRQAKKWLAHAKHNDDYTYVYESAADFVRENHLPAAREQLKRLWQDDPNYGDPDNLAEKVGLRYRNGHISSAWYILFCLFCGISSSIGILTQSWPWVLITIALMLITVCVLPRRIQIYTLLLIAFFSGVFALSTTWYASRFNYSDQEVITHTVATATYSVDASGNATEPDINQTDDHNILQVPDDLNFSMALGTMLTFLVSSAIISIIFRYRYVTENWILLLEVYISLLLVFIMWVIIPTPSIGYMPSSSSQDEWCLILGVGLVVGPLIGVGTAFFLSRLFLLQQMSVKL